MTFRDPPALVPRPNSGRERERKSKLQPKKGEKNRKPARISRFGSSSHTVPTGERRELLTTEMARERVLAVIGWRPELGCSQSSCPIRLSHRDAAGSQGTTKGVPGGVVKVTLRIPVAALAHVQVCLSHLSLERHGPERMDPDPRAGLGREPMPGGTRCNMQTWTLEKHGRHG